MKKGTLLLLMLTTICGCVKLPAPKVNPPERYLFAEGFSQDSIPYDIRWWRLFKDPELNRLEEQALRQNLTLAEAAARVEMARKRLRIARAEYLPSLDLGIEASGERVAQEGITQSYTLAPEISWELPLFDRLRSAKRVATASILESEWAFRGVILSLTAEVASTYFTLLEYEESLRIAEETLESRIASAALIDSLVRYGMQSRIDLDRARSLELSAHADIHQYRNLVEECRLSLCTLLSIPPQEIRSREWRPQLFLDSLPREVPIGLPSALLLRRPDLMESFYSLEGAEARVGVARSARLPAINLTVEGGRMAEALSDIVKGDAWLWSAVGKLSQPLFSFGRLKAAEEVAREQYYEALFAYEQSFLQALSDVEGALVRIRENRAELERYEELVCLNEEITRKSRALYRAGLSDYLDLLDAERSSYESLQELTTLRANHFIDYINLYKALGGGW